MEQHNAEQELKDRLTLIESMIAEGRRDTKDWGWTFALWGLVYFLAAGWSAWNHSLWAWPAAVLVGVMVTAVLASLKGGHYAPTTVSRAIGAIWIALGISMVLLFVALGLSGRLTDQHVFIAVMAAMLGMANGASGLILRWKIQLACAVVWWVTAVATCFGSEGGSTIEFLVAVFLCQVVFGVYGMIAGAHTRKRLGPSHA